MSKNYVVGNATPLVTYPNVLPTSTALPRPNTRRFEFATNAVGATWIIVNTDKWLVHDIGFPSFSWVGCKVRIIKRGMRLEIQHSGTWQEISADIKRG